MIPEVNPYNNYRGDGVATLFDYDFFIQNGSQLIVEHIDENDVITRLEENIDYEIVVIEEEFAGYIKFPIEDSKFGILQENETLSLQLTLPFEQISEYGQSSLLDLNSIEFSLDYLTRLCQILKRQMERSVRVNEGSEATPEQLLETINNNTVVSTNAAAIASKKADEAMESANVASSKAEEVSVTYEKAISDITTEGEKQLQNVQSTGFYMRDDKLYFINSEGEEEEFKSGGAGAVMFDTKIADHILQGEEALGWALQGTYVTKDLYTDFYNKCLEEKNNATATEATLADSALTMFVNDNGHQFFNIADKSIVDTFYNTYGIADFYGIDEENGRVFLPRNKYFYQLTDDPTKVNEMVKAGLPDHEHKAYYVKGWGQGTDGEVRMHVGTDSYQLTSMASESNPIYGNSDTVQPPSSLKLLYYCVGNTEVTQAITNVTEITTSENDTIPLFTGMYFDFKPNNASWLKAGEQQNSAGIYKTCYETLVEIVNGVNNYDLKVINQADMISGVVYDEYWILDQDNLTFRTPLTISSRVYESVAPVAGNGMALGLTNGEENFGLLNRLSGQASFFSGNLNSYGANIGDTSSGGTYLSTSVSEAFGVTTDSAKSGIEAHLVENTTAQLYFKVANAVQNLELLDAGEVLESLASVVPNSSSLISSYSMPANNYIDLTMGASGTEYIAPANGWFTWEGFIKGSVGYFVIRSLPSNIGSQSYSNYNMETGMMGVCSCPFKKGDVVKVGYYASTSITTTLFRFVYAEGEV